MMRGCQTIATVIICLLHAGASVGHAQQPSRDRPIVVRQSKQLRPFAVWDREPAKRWDHAYPVGNGRLGAMSLGGYPNEQILLNDDTIWQGRNTMSNRYDIMFMVEEGRELLFAGEYAKAQELINSKLLVPRITPRAFQPMGYLHLDYQDPGEIRRYERRLSMNEGVATTELETADGNTIRQEVFSSWPDDVIVVRIESKRPEALSMAVGMDRPANFATEARDDRTLIMHGQAQNDAGEDYDATLTPSRRNPIQNRDTQRGVCWHGVARVLPQDGRSIRSEDQIVVENASAVTILITASTDYNHRRPFIPLRHDRLARCLAILAKVESVPYQTLRKRMTEDHRQFFDRATVDIGTTSTEQLKKPTPQRMAAMKTGGRDPDLLEDLFQMGRYMLIASSRPGTLPPNLTGIWNGNMNPPCHSDWHLNINVQQNFQHAETTNLSELHEPLITLTDDLSKGQGKLLAEKLGCRGFCVTHATHAWKEAAFSGHTYWGMWPMGGAWCCGHVMEHYRFTHDKDYLADTAYPILKENVEFLLDWLVEHPETGRLVSGPSGSPENAFSVGDGEEPINVCMGPAIDQMIAHESFTDFLEAAEVLGIENETTRQVRKSRARLAEPQIGSDGRIMEWDKEYKEVKLGHRHFSHLYALHPGCEITPERTPKLFEAARKSLDTRLEHGSGRHGWSRAWVVNLKARLRDGNGAYDQLRVLVDRFTLPNLMHTQPPIFFDGNGAGTAAVAEMLLQSHAGFIHLLPALPEAWPTGSFQGLCARGGFEIDVTWKDGKPAQATVQSMVGGEFRLKTDSEVDVRCDEETVNTTRDDSGCVSVSTREGETYELQFTQGVVHAPKGTPK